MSDSPPTNEECRAVPGYQGEYLICESGAIWSKKGGVWSKKAAWTEHGHETVTLYRHGHRTRRRVQTIRREVFGTTTSKFTTDHELGRYLRRTYGLDDHEVAAILNGERP